MRIFKVDDYDRLRDGSHHLDREISTFDLSKFHEAFYRPLLERLLGLELWGPGDFPIVAAISVTTTVKDGMFYVGGHTSTGWEMKAGTLAFDNNHMQLWQRDRNGRARLEVGSLFYEQVVPFVQNKDWGNVDRLVVESVRDKSKQLRDAQRENVQELYQRLGAAQTELHIREDQLLYSEQQLIHVHLE